jgi:hypothetical protein
MWLEGLGELKNPVTSYGIKSTSFQILSKPHYIMPKGKDAHVLTQFNTTS